MGERLHVSKTWTNKNNDFLFRVPAWLGCHERKVVRLDKILKYFNTWTVWYCTCPQEIRIDLDWIGQAYDKLNHQWNRGKCFYMLKKCTHLLKLSGLFAYKLRLAKNVVLAGNENLQQNWIKDNQSYKNCNCAEIYKKDWSILIREIYSVVFLPVRPKND